MGGRLHRAKRPRRLDCRRVASGRRAPRRAMAGRARTRVGRRNNRRPVDRRRLDLHADRDASPGLHRRRARRQAHLLREAARNDRGRSRRDGRRDQSVGRRQPGRSRAAIFPRLQRHQGDVRGTGRRPTAQRHDARRPGLPDPRLARERMAQRSVADCRRHANRAQRSRLRSAAVDVRPRRPASTAARAS